MWWRGLSGITVLLRKQPRSKKSPPTHGWPLYEPSWALLSLQVGPPPSAHVETTHRCTQCSCALWAAHSSSPGAQSPAKSCGLTVPLQSSITLNKKTIALCNNSMQKVHFKMNFSVKCLQWRVENSSTYMNTGSHLEQKQVLCHWYLLISSVCSRTDYEAATLGKVLLLLLLGFLRGTFLK